MADATAAPNPAPPYAGALGRRVVANTAANFAGQAALLALAFFATPYIVGRFGASRYGVLLLVLSFVNLLALFQLGFNVGLVKYLSASFAANDSAEVERYVRTALVLYLAIGVAVAVVLGLETHWLVLRFFQLPVALRREATTGLGLAAAAFAIRFVAEVFNSVPIAAQRFDIVNALFAGSEMVRIAGSVLVVWRGHFVPAVLAVALGSSVLFLAGSIVAAAWLLPGVRLWPAVSGPHLRQLLHFSKFAAISQLATRSGSLDGPILAHFVSAASVAFYMVPCALCLKIRTVAGNVASAAFPALSSLAAPADAVRLRELYLRGTKIVFGLVALPSLALVLVGGAVLARWINPEFARHGALVLGILSAGFLVNTLMHIPDTLANSLGRPALPAGFNTAETLAKYALFFVLVPRFGIAGAAAGFLGTQIALAPWFIGAANRMVGVSWQELFRRAYLPAAVPLGSSLCALCFCRSHLGSLAELMAVLFVVTSIYLLLGTIFILDGRDRMACFSLLKYRLPFANRILQPHADARAPDWPTRRDGHTAGDVDGALPRSPALRSGAPAKNGAATIDLTVTIANWNRADQIESCLDSIYKTAEPLEYEVIVVDNASADESTEMVLTKFPQTRLIRNRVNAGFARAHNQAFSLARGRYFAVLNSDAAVLPATLPALVHFMEEHPRAGICTCPATDSANRHVTGGGIRRFPSLAREVGASLLAAVAPPFAWRNHAAFLRLSEWVVGKSPLQVTCQVPCAGGALLLIRRQMVEQVGGFDERFFLYFEETDLCRRAGLAHWEIWHVASTRYRHEGHQSSDLRSDAESIFQASGARYFREHSGRLAASAFVLQRRILCCWLPRWRRVLGEAVRTCCGVEPQAVALGEVAKPAPIRHTVRRAGSPFPVEEERTP